ncbi:MAG TPA: gamma-glutamyltransferase family protein [Caulobacteraceae bacterium]|nr:gamma-glutamyltransferase family protein [Caulobacteraceae bacterium]
MIGFPRPDAPRPVWPRRRLGPAFGLSGMAAAAHPLTVETAVGVLRAGGNAVDAAVAAGLTAAVVMPEMCGLGGDLFAIVHAPGEAPVAVLGSGIAPRAATLEQMRAAGPQTPSGPKMPLTGPLSIGAPGMVHAYGALLERFGSRPFADLAAPAIAHAERGFPLTVSGAAAIGLYAELLARVPATATVLLPGGRAPRAGEVLVQADLARTLRQLAAEGCGAFYGGPLADRIAGSVQALGGALSAGDLADHTTVLEPPLSTTYRGCTVWQTGLPSQGLILLEALNIAEQAEAAMLARGDAAATHLLVEATKLAYADRMAYACDPAVRATPVETLLSKAWAARRHAAIDPDRAAEETPAAALTDGDTTYLCVVDGAGMMVSLIQSVSSAFGSGVVAEGTGVILNNRVGRGFTLEDGHPNQFAPGKKTMHTLNCWSLAGPDGVPVMVGGTPGGDGQPQWNLQMLTGLIDAGLDVQAACELPRWSMWPGTDPADRPNPYELRVETRLGDEALAGLAARGHRLKPTGAWGGTGAAQIIARDPATGVLAGGSDPRAEGLAMGL